MEIQVEKRFLNTRQLVLNGLIAALYFTITLLTANVAYHGVQFRFAEALLLLVFIDKKLVFGVLAGTFLANFFGPFGLVDAIFGTLATVIAVVCMIFVAVHFKPTIVNMASSGLFPTIVNALYVPVLLAFMDPTVTFEAYLPIALSVAIGEFVVVSVMGSVIFYALSKRIEGLK